MDFDPMNHEEAVALTKFVKERLVQLDKRPMFFGKRKWEEGIARFEANFSDVLEEGENNFYGAIWQFFEGRDDIFLGENGMLELAEHTKKKENTWIYQNWHKKIKKVIYAA